jgi:hypothetical protein
MALMNRVDVYVFDRTALDADGGIDRANAYADTPDYAALPATVQVESGDREESEQLRVTSVNTGSVMFAANVAYIPAINDKIVWVDPEGTTHNLFVGGSVDNAGRGSAVSVSVVERV